MTLPLHLPDYSTHRRRYGAGGASWQVWHKPLNASWVEIAAVGSGGGGGGAQANVADSGGGGGSSGYAFLRILAALLPDIIYVQVAPGGAGGGNNASGGNGALSYVSVAPSTAVAGLLLVSGAAAAVGGVTGGASGAGGTAGTVATVANCALARLGDPSFLPGQIGADQGNSTTALGVSITCGGAGGGRSLGSPNVGGTVTGAGPLVTLPGGAAGPGARSGSGGYNLWAPFCSMGGSGGGSDNAGAGGNGGAGAIGSGGGGGGYGTSTGSGFGGRGGDGMVEIWVY